MRREGWVVTSPVALVAGAAAGAAAASKGGGGCGGGGDWAVGWPQETPGGRSLGLGWSCVSPHGGITG